MGFEDRSWMVQRFWSSSPEVFRAGAGGQTVPIQGRTFLIRSDFPVLVFFDGQQVAAVNGAFPPIVRIKLAPTDKSPATMTLRFPVGEGMNQAGALVASDIQGRHGNFCMDYAWNSDVILELVHPDLLPCTTFAQVSNAIAAGGPGATPVGLSWASNDFTIPFLQTRPNELYVKQIAWGFETSVSLGPAPAGEYVYEIIHATNDSPVGDLETLWIVEGSASGHTVPMQNLKIPLRAIFENYAAEGGKGMNTGLFSTARADGRIFTMRLMCAYQ